MDVAMCRKYKKAKGEYVKDGRKMQKFLKKYGYDVGRKHAGHLIYEKDGVPYKASIGNHKPMNKGFQRRIMKEAAAAAASANA